MTERGTGRTTRQLLAAQPKSVFFVATHAQRKYTTELARHLGRRDVTVETVDNMRHIFHRINVEPAMDHHCYEISLPDRVWEEYFELLTRFEADDYDERQALAAQLAPTFIGHSLDVPPRQRREQPALGRDVRMFIGENIVQRDRPSVEMREQSWRELHRHMTTRGPLTTRRIRGERSDFGWLDNPDQMPIFRPVNIVQSETREVAQPVTPEAAEIIESVIAPRMQDSLQREIERALIGGTDAMASNSPPTPADSALTLAAMRQAMVAVHVNDPTLPRIEFGRAEFRTESNFENSNITVRVRQSYAVHNARNPSVICIDDAET